MSLLNELKRRNVIRVGIAYTLASWLIIQVIETLFPVFDFSNEAIRIVVILLAIGLLPVLFFAWAFELTPEGLKRDKDVDRSHSITPQTGKKLDRWVIVMLVLALTYFAFDKFILDPARDAQIAETSAQKGRTEALVESYGESSIAVLPFVNMSDDSSNEYFSDGISEELLNLLAKIPGLRVISRSSSFTYKGKDIDIPTIAKQLNVTLILEGSVRKADDKVRITAQLIEARSDTHLWSDTFDRELSDIFAIQDEISAAIVTSLKEILGLNIDAAPRAIATANTRAHEAFLRGRYLVNQRTQISIENAIVEFEKAIMIDPDYAVAHAELAIAILLLARRNYGELSSSDAVSQADPQVKRALALDASLAEAYAAAGFQLSVEGSKGEEAIGQLKKAIELDPNYTDAYHWLGLQYRNLGPAYLNETFVALEKAVQLDPLSSRSLAMYIIALAHRGRFAEADIELEKLATMNPALHANTRGYCQGLRGNTANHILGLLDQRLLERGSLKKKQWRISYPLATMGLEKETIAALKEARVFQVDQWLLLGKASDALASAEARLAKNPDSVHPIVIEWFQISTGDYTSFESWEKAWQEDPGGWDGNDMAAMIAMRRHAGKDNDVSDLLTAMKKQAQQNYDAGIANRGVANYEYGLATFLGGDQDKGIELIGKAVEDHAFIFPNVAFLQSLYKHPDYAPIIAMQKAWQKRERNKFLAVVCNENPYEAIWQPEEGTCEQFLAENRN